MEGDTFHVIEVQSDWAQTIREGPIVTGKQESLLGHYERLAQKAAIEHAREAGAKRIAISDAETAMMTEGHDSVAGQVKHMIVPFFLSAIAYLSQIASLLPGGGFL